MMRVVNYELISFILCLFLCTKLAHGSLWEYGEDDEKARNVGFSSGDLLRTDETKRIEFEVPDCTEIVYVKIEIDNDFSSPLIQYNRHVHIVTLHYRPPQKSGSSYRILLKGVPMKNCNIDGTTEKRSKKKKKSGKRGKSKNKKKKKGKKGSKKSKNKSKGKKQSDESVYDNYSPRPRITRAPVNNADIKTFF